MKATFFFFIITHFVIDYDMIPKDFSRHPHIYEFAALEDVIREFTFLEARDNIRESLGKSVEEVRDSHNGLLAEQALIQRYLPYINLLREERRDYCDPGCDVNCMREKLQNREEHKGVSLFLDILETYPKLSKSNICDIIQYRATIYLLGHYFKEVVSGGMPELSLPYEIPDDIMEITPENYIRNQHGHRILNFLQDMELAINGSK